MLLKVRVMSGIVFNVLQATGPGYKPRDLFNAGRDRAHTVASESPTKERCTMRQRSKSFAIKVNAQL